MNRFVTCMLVLLGAAVAACSVQMPIAPPPATATATALPRKSGTLRFSLTGNLKVLDVPRLMALDSLKEQGYTVEQTNLASSDLIPISLVRGDIEFGSSDTSVMWSAIAKSADLRTVVGRTNTTFYLVTKQELQTCGDLNGRPIAFNSSTSVGSLMFQSYIKQNCPGITPQILLINDSNNRMASLQTGNTDGAWLELDAWLQLQRQAPGKFHILVDFAKEFPKFQYSAFAVRRTWAEQNPETIKDFIRALLIAQRRIIGNPQLLSDQIVKYLSLGPADAQAAADAYLKLGVWDANGGLTSGSIQYMIEFLASTNSLPAGVKANDVTDLSYLNAVLDEMGRK
jgi:NitT/TauT family transport system substrate-binding protein